MLTLDFSDLSEWTVPLVGGKARSLAKLRAAGVNVPDAFCITTSAYRQFCDAAPLKAILNREEWPSTSAELTSLSMLFATTPIPEGLWQEIRARRRLLGQPLASAVAVRSSATTEDSAAASFAGQFDTVLNVKSEAELDSAIRQCWASFWSDHAILYRNKMGARGPDDSMAVVVQRLVEAQASGVLFTKHPVSNIGDEMLLSASWGLGQAVVSGEVTPDEWIMAKPDGKEIREDIGNKQKMAVPCEGGSTLVDVPESRRTVPSVSSSVRQQLFRMGLHLEVAFRGPQDIEWAIQGGTIFVLQSRPITT